MDLEFRLGLVPRVRVKDGVNLLDINRAMGAVVVAAIESYKIFAGEDFITITSAVDSHDDKPPSFHNDGYGLDFRAPGWGTELGISQDAGKDIAFNMNQILEDRGVQVIWHEGPKPFPHIHAEIDNMTSQLARKVRLASV